MRFATLLFTLTLLMLLPLKSQNSDESAFAGTHFIVGFMQNEVTSITGGRTHKIILNAQDTSSVEIYYKGILQNTFIAIPDTAYEFVLDPTFMFEESEEIGEELLEFQSDKPILCYVFSSQSTSSDSYIAHPVSAWGKEYVITTLGIDHYYPDNTIPDSLTRAYRNAKRPGEFLIIASEDSTNVYIDPSASTEKNWSGSDSQILLDKGEAYLVKAYPRYFGDNDLTGSYIKSDKPVGVLTGHVRTAIPQRLMRDRDTKDHLVEMIYSIDRWSKKYISVPFEIDTVHTGDMFKITSAYDSTIVNMDWGDKQIQFTLNGIGDFKTIDSVDRPIVWTSNKPVQIAQFMSHSLDFNNYSDIFDPSMLILPPQDKMVKKLFYSVPEYISEYYRYNKEIQFVAHKIGLLMTQTAISDLTINGNLVNEIDSINIVNIEGTNLYYTNLSIQIGSNKLETKNGYFAAWTYGHGHADSYAMTLGSSLSSFVSNDSLSPEIAISESCGNIEGRIKDQISSSGGGLGTVFPIQSDTDNYIFEITNQTDGLIEFSAEPDNKLEDARLTIDYRDLAGNGGVFRYQYKGLKIDFRGDMGIPNTEIGESSFAYYSIKNNSDTIRTIYSLNFFKDDRLSYKLDNGQSLPYEMQPGEEVLIKIIFSPVNSASPLDDSIYVRIDCNYISRSKVTSSVLLPDITPIDVDFGKVLIFKSKSQSLQIVNNGATDVVLENLDYIDYIPEFQVDTTDVFPYNLLIGDTLRLKVTFSPTQKKVYTANLYFNNNKKISNSVSLTGIGASPVLTSLVVDWGLRRVGTTNDTVVYINNTGDWQAKVSYSDTEISTNNDDNLVLLEGLDEVISEDDSIALNLKYRPIEDELYRIITSNEISELEDSLFQIELRGEPSLPEIVIYEINLGNVYVDESKNGTYDAFLVEGNEQLHIRSIKPVSPINDEFNLDIQTKEAQYYLPGTTITTNVSFTATELGRREQFYLIENDALPNYQYKTDTLKVYANVIPRDTILADMRIINESENICRTQDITVQVSNHGNIDFNITNINYNFKELPYSYKPDSFELPISVTKGKSYNFNISNIHKYYDENTLAVEITINDTIKIEKSVDLHYSKLEAEIVETNSIETEIGSMDTILIKGTLPKTDIDIIGMEIEIEYDEELLQFENKEVELIIRRDDSIDTLKSKIIMLQNQIIFTEPLEIISDDKNAEWSIELPFKVLYKNQKTSVVNFTANFSACYLDIVEKIDVKVLPICIFDLLPIKINDKLPSVSINSRIVRSEIDLEVFIPSQDYVFIEVYDVTGSLVLPRLDNLLENGLHQMKLDIEELPIGSYLLHVQYQSYSKKILFIKSI